VFRQYSMYEYHATLKATHPYASAFWEWPLDARPVSYYYKDLRRDHNDANGVGVREILSLPNPLILWLGLLTVPAVGVLAWYQRRKAYALIVLAYLMQWIPWIKSPRIAFAYHFYVDIPLICLCNVIAMQWLWNQFKDRTPTTRIAVAAGIGVYVVAVGFAFAFFYPVLAATPLSWNGWNARMWHALVGNNWI
jgi:dolichyl-phosphate-mannose-protein mannosyltransferase